MSTDSPSHAGNRTLGLDATGAFGPGTFRLLALGCVLVLTASYVSVLRDVTLVVGGTRSLDLLVGAVLVGATVLAWTIRPRTAVVGALLAGALGFAYYLEVSGVGVAIVFSAQDAIVADTIALATGLPLLRMVEAGVWTLAFAPAPIFLSWYLAVRGRYGLAVLPGGFALFFLVLTGDAGTVVTVLGTSGALGALAFGELERRDGSIAQADLLAISFTLIMVLSLSVSFVPGGPSGPAHPGSGEDGSLEGTIDYSSDRSGISGAVDLSPEVRFTVESEEPAYWRTGVYDRFTGDEWVRTGESSEYDESLLEEPPGEYDEVEQVVTAETDLGVMPAAGQPLSLDGDLADHAEVSSHGHVHPTSGVLEGDSYAVESAIVDPDASELENAGTDYPDEIAESDYVQTPEGTSSEFEDRAAELTEDADTPYEKAVAIEEYLRTSNEYSLDVDQPSGNVAEAFLFEMNEGYCVYFATTMTQLLRAEDVPTRYVTGYTSGQEVDDDEHVVRGTDAHAWVEVYFPEHGWVAFEPTPPEDRADEHTDSVEQARSDGASGVDTDSSEDEPITDDDEESGDDSSEPDHGDDDGSDDGDDWNETDPGSDDDPAANETDPDENESDSDQTDDDTISEPSEEGDSSDGDDESILQTVVSLLAISRETVAVALVALVGVLASAYRVDATTRLGRTLGLYWQRRRDDPDEDAQRAFRRLEELLAREYRPRKPSESARTYIRSLESPGTASDQTLDSRCEIVLERYERAVYGGGISRAEADETIETVDELARERLPGR
ncbi:protein of unknown function [Natronorubrum sediminis]|uniref:Transglutaminase-like domain-containing protein n=1 Tax=Natronorubrum sediminis TaxID=640943 RepID=A0A1H6G2L3_9EURY|nr:DUF3488 and transglutaminase-like domain-containing protein [Natronorubrum sediminis]SEH16842.1 protein of unknown function [Natronorubrum sediminis]